MSPLRLGNDLVGQHVAVVLQGRCLQVGPLQELRCSTLKRWRLLLLHDDRTLLLLQFSGVLARLLGPGADTDPLVPGVFAGPLAWSLAIRTDANPDLLPSATRWELHVPVERLAASLLGGFQSNSQSWTCGEVFHLLTRLQRPDFTVGKGHLRIPIPLIFPYTSQVFPILFG